MTPDPFDFHFRPDFTSPALRSLLFGLTTNTIAPQSVEPKKTTLLPPPFDPGSRCPACGFATAATVFCGPGDRVRMVAHDCADLTPRHLVRICMRCKCPWAEAALDDVARHALERSWAALEVNP